LEIASASVRTRPNDNRHPDLCLRTRARERTTVGWCANRERLTAFGGLWIQASTDEVFHAERLVLLVPRLPERLEQMVRHDIGLTSTCDRNARDMRTCARSYRKGKVGWRRHRGRVCRRGARGCRASPARSCASTAACTQSARSRNAVPLRIDIVSIALRGGGGHTRFDFATGLAGGAG
jgi:hypothetical protein